MSFFNYVLISPIFGTLLSILKIYEIILIIRIILSWINPDPYNKLVIFLYSITDPLLDFFRRVLPIRIGMIDLSPILAFISIEILQRILYYLIIITR